MVARTWLSFHGHFHMHMEELVQNSFALGKQSLACLGCSYIFEYPALKKAKIRGVPEGSCLRPLPLHLQAFLSSFTCSLLFLCSEAANPNQQLNPPFVCVADDKCMEDILCCLGRQGTYFDWCSVVEKKWARKELQWRACRLEGDILISPALSSLLAFGDEAPSGGKWRGCYWCKTAWNALRQVALYINFVKKYRSW